MRKRALTLATTIALLVLSVAPAMATPPGDDPGLVDGHKITICHVTNSESNPFVIITIDVAAWHTEGSIGHSRPSRESKDRRPRCGLGGERLR